MRRLLVPFLAAALALPLFAGEPKPSPCRADACKPAEHVQAFPQMAFSMRGIRLDANWVMKNADGLVAQFGDACVHLNDCLAIPGNSFTFCDEVLGKELRKTCDTSFPRQKSFNDWDQCVGFTAMYAISVEQQVIPKWKEAQACAAEQPLPENRALKVWIEPRSIAIGKPSKFTVYSVDASSGAPLYAKVKIDGELLTQTEEIDPTGTSGTWYVILHTLKRRADGSLPKITVEAQNYPVAPVDYEAK